MTSAKQEKPMLPTVSPSPEGRQAEATEPRPARPAHQKGGYTDHATRRITVHLRPHDERNLETIRHALSPLMPAAVSDADAVRYAIQQTADRLTDRLRLAATAHENGTLEMQG
jgi:hypothetical protein